MDKKPSLIDSKGRPQIKMVGIKKKFSEDLYHHFIMKPWSQFLLVIITVFLTINFLFTLLYILSDGVANCKEFLDYFFFSIQTLSTIGYGFMYPTNLMAHFLVSCESFMGILFISILTGLFYSKFSLPTAKVIYTKQCIVSYDEDDLSFKFRMANTRQSQIVDANIRVSLLKSVIKKDGNKIRKIHDMKLVRDQIPTFLLSFTCQHIIDKESPFFGETHQSLVEKEALIIVIITGIDEGTSQSIHSRKIYTFDDIVWNATFKDVLLPDNKGQTYVDYNFFDELIYH